jgi:hypothetical protein
VSHKTLHPGLHFWQPSGLRTPEACWNISPGLSECNERNPGYRFVLQTAPREGCEDHFTNREFFSAAGETISVHLPPNTNKTSHVVLAWGLQKERYNPGVSCQEKPRTELKPSIPPGIC